MKIEVTDPLMEAALNYARSGIPVFPCLAIRKQPFVENGFRDAATDPAIVRKWWKDKPRSNIGMPTGRTSGIIIVDVDPRNGGDESLDKLIAMHGQLPDTPCVLTGGGGIHIMLAHPGRNISCSSGVVAKGIDIKGDGGYSILPPSGHESNNRYQWMGDQDLLQKRPAQCPQWLLEIIGCERQKGPEVSCDGNLIPEGHRNNALASLAGGMRRMGMSCQEILASLLEANANRCRPPLDHREVERIAQSIARYQPDSVSVALVENHFDQSFDEDRSLYSQSLPVDPGPLPEKTLRIPGFISEVMDYTLETAPYPSIPMAFCGAVAMQSFLSGRKVRDTGKGRTNIYILALAGSSTGKDHARRVNSDILMHTGQLAGLGNKFASGEGIQDALFETPCMLFQNDEIDDMLQSISKSRDARWEGVMSTLLMMYSSSTSVFAMRRKAGKQQADFIDQPSLTIFGTAIPEHYYKAMSERMLTNGLLGRMIIVEATTRSYGRDDNPLELPDRIIKTAKWWADFQPSEKRANLKNLHPVPKIVEYTPQAQKNLSELRRYCDEQYFKANDQMDEVAKTIWGRATENSRKMALIYACSQNHENPLVTDEAIQWSGDFIKHQAQRMLFMANQNVSQNDFDADCKRLLKILHEWKARHGDEWMPFWRLNRRLPWPTRQHEDVRVCLLNQKLIDYTEAQTGGPEKRLYRLL